MDKILRHAQAHGEIFEALSLFNKAITIIDGKKTIAHLRDISKLFSRDIVSHLKFEENQIFPLVFSDGTLRDKEFVRSLQYEHLDVLGKIDQFKALFLKCKFQSKANKNMIKDLVKLSREIIKMMLEHSRKEDSELFPLLKCLGYSLEDKENV